MASDLGDPADRPLLSFGSALYYTLSDYTLSQHSITALFYAVSQHCITLSHSLTHTISLKHTHSLFFSLTHTLSLSLDPGVVICEARSPVAGVDREIGRVLPNSQRQHRSVHVQQDVLP
jgi:hypothetical protein